MPPVSIKLGASSGRVFHEGARSFPRPRTYPGGVFGRFRKQGGGKGHRKVPQNGKVKNFLNLSRIITLMPQLQPPSLRGAKSGG